MNTTNKQQAIDQDTVNRVVWQACDTFRGTVDSSVYKDYVLIMLFLKYISDVWQDHYDGLQRKYGNHPEVLEEMLKNERFTLPESANFYTLYKRRHDAGNGKRIDHALRALTESNDEKLHSVFQETRFNTSKLGSEQNKNDILCHLLADFAKPELDLRPSRVGSLDIIGNAYEFLIKNFASSSGKKAGEFYTPPEISQLIALLVDPQDGDQICDPTCGSGSLLMKCGQLVRKRNPAHKYELYGQESMGSTWDLAKMNMFLHGEDNHRIEWADTLREPRLLDKKGDLLKFDVVVANPPFSLEQWAMAGAKEDLYNRFERGMPPKTRADYAFIQHMVATMKAETGRMAVVVPNGVLFRGAKEGLIRKKLIEDNLLDAVIGLPEKLFYGTGISAVILVMRTKKSDDTVLFINASKSFQPGKNQNLLREEDIARIMDAFHARADIVRFAHLASRKEIEENDYNLNIARYTDIIEEEEEIDLPALQTERNHLKTELGKLDGVMDAMLVEFGFLPGPAR